MASTLSQNKSICAVNLPLKLFRPTVANSESGKLKAPHTLLDTYLDHMLAKFEPNRMVRNAGRNVTKMSFMTKSRVV